MEAVPIKHAVPVEPDHAAAVAGGQKKGEEEQDDIDVWSSCLADAFENFEVGDDDEVEVEDPGKGFKKKDRAPRVERIEYSSISRDEFRERYLATNEPIILGNYPDIPPFDVEYWRQHRGDCMVPLDIAMPTERLVKMRDFLRFDTADDSEGGVSMRSGYLRSIHTAEWFEKENNAIVWPDVLGMNHLADTSRNFPRAWRRWYELFINTRDSPGFPFLHRDMCSTYAYSFQVQGIKRFWLFPPSDTQYLYPSGGSQCRSKLDVRQVVAETVDPAVYPLYRHATMHIADIRSGDLLFVPSDWWHTTTVVSAEPSVTLGGNYVGEHNLEAFENGWSEYLRMKAMTSSGAVTLEMT